MDSICGVPNQHLLLRNWRSMTLHSTLLAAINFHSQWTRRIPSLSHPQSPNIPRRLPRSPQLTHAQPMQDIDRNEKKTATHRRGDGQRHHMLFVRNQVTSRVKALLSHNAAKIQAHLNPCVLNSEPNPCTLHPTPYTLNAKP